MKHRRYWTPEKIAARLKLIEPLVYHRKSLLPPFSYQPLAGPHVPPPLNADDSAWELVPYKTYWGSWNTDFVMQSRLTVPAEWDVTSPIALFLPIGDAVEFCHPETLVYIDGQPIAASDRAHEEVRIPDRFRDGASHRLTLHGWTGIGMNDSDLKLFMRECFLVQINQPTRELIVLARLALDVAAQLDSHDRLQGQLYNALDAAFVALDTRDPLGTSAFYGSVPAALEILKKGIDGAGQPMPVDMVAVGHAHIDTAWLWTLDQTVRKAGRTFSTVLHLMEQYPDYKFSQSQPQLYRYIEQHYPDLFHEIKARVQENRWEVMGGTWVEPDCNAIGAESLVRQFLLGRAYFRQHFGEVETPVLWLPDTFGYSWALPQLIKQAGLRYFVTHKMSWNQYNQMPHQLFWWQGLDGTRVLTYFLTIPAPMPNLPDATTYNGVVTAAEVFGTWRGFRQKETHQELLYTFGEGDGGGGPNRDMLDTIAQLGNFPGAPRMRHGTVREFMDRLEQSIPEDLPIWNGEFYLEYHRGTYTSQSRTKRHNRKCEFLLHDAEVLAAWASLVTDYNYPHQDLTEAWRLLCLNQFHDILPGTSIAQVYIDTERDYAEIRRIGEAVRDAAMDVLSASLPASSTILVVNTTSFGGRRIGLLSDSLAEGISLMDAQGVHVLTQTVSNGTLVEIPYIESYSVIGLKEAAGSTAGHAEEELRIGLTDALLVLENALLRVEMNADGEISRVYDKQVSREVLPPHTTANTLLAFEDRPLNFDAWDIDSFYDDRTERITGLERMEVIEDGPLRVGVEIERRYRNSYIVQRVYVYRDSRRIDFDTSIDWHEQHILLKVAFPVDVMSPLATFDVQWGNVQRPTHRNTFWDFARFETCAQKWMDLSEGNYGVALLNDCKYGHEVHHNVMRLTLLKSATDPDPTADQGEHHMVYSLFPHTRDWRSEVIDAAYDLNIPLLLRRVKGETTGKGMLGSLVSVNVDWVVIETIKQAEAGNGLIVRLYEHHRNRGRIAVHTGFPLAEAYVCNLLEENQQRLELHGDSVLLDVTPYQIVTLRLIPVKLG